MTLKTAYRYHPKYFYFLSTQTVQEGPGIYLPNHCTEIAPPECKENEVAVFNEKDQKWTVQIDTFPRTKRILHWLRFLKPETPSRILFASRIGEFDDPNFGKLFNFFSKLSPMDNYVNPFLFTLSFKQRLNHLNNRIEEFFTQYNRILSKLQSNHAISMDECTAYRVEMEEIIHEIKRLFDLVVMTVGIEHSGIEYYDSTHQVKLQSISQLWSKKPPVVEEEIKEACLLDSYIPLLNLVNDLHNGLKHDILAEESNSSHFPLRPHIELAKIANQQGYLKVVNVYRIDFEFFIHACNGYLCDVINGQKDVNAHTLIGVFRAELPKF